jgi:hypothetical protein
MTDAPSSIFSRGFLERLNQANADAARNVHERTKAERRANRTDAEKTRRGRPKGPPLTQLNMRVTAQTSALARELAEHLGKSMPATIALALAALAINTPGFKMGERQQ